MTTEIQSITTDYPYYGHLKRGAVMQIAERAVNDAIRKGATQVSIRYRDWLDEDGNAMDDMGCVRVVGYRVVEANA